MFQKIMYCCCLVMLMGIVPSCDSGKDALPENQLRDIDSYSEKGGMADSLNGSSARIPASVGREDLIKGINDGRIYRGLPELKMVEGLNKTALYLAQRNSLAVLPIRARYEGFNWNTINAAKYQTKPYSTPFNNVYLMEWMLKTPHIRELMYGREFTHFGVASVIVGNLENYVFIGGTLKARGK